MVELRVGAASGAARSYDLGILRDIPTPNFEKLKSAELDSLVEEMVMLTQRMNAVEETSIYFWLPILLKFCSNSLRECFKSWESNNVKS